jgi:ABC-type lipoprotein export system ATPase subunit
MNDPKGSIWRKWDLHIHTPYSYLNNGFGDDFDLYVKTLFKKAISKNIASIGITDYFTIDGYKKITEDYLNKPDKLKQLFSDEEIERIKQILILPNIEFRLHDLVNGRRINFHVIFSNDVDIMDIEEHFLHDLDFVHESQPFERDNVRKLKKSNLIELGKRLKQEQPDFTGEDLFVGMSTATVQHKDISDKLQDTRFKEKFIIGVPPDEDLSDIDWSSQEHMIRKLIIQKSNFLFASNPKTVKWALGKFDTEEQFISEFKSLKPCLWGSDAHNFEKLFEPDLERYCWIKADPTFEGVRQILYEPEERVFIGKEPEILNLIRNNPTKYFSKLEIKPLDSYNGKYGKWFDNTTIEFNNGLSGIIGNKGKGKSAIADILGLLGNTKVSLDSSKDKLFSFLNKNKFCKKGYAENFHGVLHWNDGKTHSKKLDEDIDETEIEKIKYIPQKFFEDLCSTEDDLNFREELNKVVFSRVENKDRLGKKTFDEFIEYKTELINAEIKKLKSVLEELNIQIVELEEKNTPEYKSTIDNKIKGKTDELEAHRKIKEEIIEIKNPSEDEKLSEEQKKKSETISSLSEKINKLQEEIEINLKKQEILEIDKYEIIRILEDIEELKRFVAGWKDERKEIFEKYDIDVERAINLDIRVETLNTTKQQIENELKSIENLLSQESVKDENNNEISLVVQIETYKSEKAKIDNELEKPFKDYHDYLQKIKDWEKKKKEIEGDVDTPDSLKYYQREKKFIEQELGKELEQKNNLREDTSISIYRKKQEVQNIYNNVKNSITDLLARYSIDQHITLETSFQVEPVFYKEFFDQFVKRYKDFYLNADNHLKQIVENYNLDNEKAILEFINEILTKEKILKESITEVEFLNFLFSIDYLNPRYNLKLNNKGLSELSPGERGGLLLIFYLILDKDDKPLVIDQPEDNLDNQSVSEILVPYIREAKKRRQIIMVTHNPNLAVVADADQIIRMNIDKENDYLVSHISGAIENPEINKAVVDILEGKMKAFNNRRIKYRN